MTDRAVTSNSVAELLERDEAFFMGQTKEELVGSILQLIQNTKKITSSSSKLSGKKRSASEANTNENGTSTASAGAIDVDASVQSLRKIIPKQIKAQMVWKPSCKTGKAMWKSTKGSALALKCFTP